MPNIWIVTVVVALLAFLSVRTYHITLKRRFGQISVEVDTRLLGVVTTKTREFNSVIGAYLKSVTDREGFQRYRVFLNASIRDDLLNGVNVSYKRAFELTEQINDFIVNSGLSKKTILIKQGVAQRNLVIMILLVVLVVNSNDEMQTTLNDKGENISNGSSNSREVGSVAKKEFSNIPDIPDGAMKPEFCTITEITADAEGGKYDLWGEMTLPIMHAGNKVNASMRNTIWEPYDMIKQSDAASLNYTNGAIHLSYTFLQNPAGLNTCIISWQPVDYNEKMNARIGLE